MAETVCGPTRTRLPASPPLAALAIEARPPSPSLIPNHKVEMMSSAPSTAKPEVSVVQLPQNERASLPAERALMGADEFSGMISRERKRSDRSGKGFVLMLVESRALFAQSKASQKLTGALLSCV